jgi:hypothetical protein
MSLLGRENNQSKGSPEGVSWEHLRNRKKARVAGTGEGGNGNRNLPCEVRS